MMHNRFSVVDMDVTDEVRKIASVAVEANEHLKKDMEELAGKNDMLTDDILGMEKVCEELRKENKRLREDNATLRQSNVLLEEETDMLRQMNRELSEDYEAMMKYVSAMEKRGFWSRVFNREV